MNPSSRWAALRYIICGLVILYALAPMAIIVIISFSSAAFLTFPPPGASVQWYVSFLSDPVWMRSLATSLLITIPAALLATIVGTGAAVGVVRGRIPLPSFVSAIVMMPLVVPTIITAAAIFGAFQPLGLRGTYSGLVLTHVVLTVPYVFSITYAALETVSPSFEDAARTLGASPARVLLRVTVPMIGPGIMSGLLFAAVMSFDELVVSMFLSSPQVRPIAVQMWTDVQSEANPKIAAIATALFLITLLLLLLDQVVSRGRAGVDRI